MTNDEPQTETTLGASRLRLHWLDGAPATDVPVTLGSLGAVEIAGVTPTDPGPNAYFMHLAYECAIAGELAEAAIAGSALELGRLLAKVEPLESDIPDPT